MGIPAEGIINHLRTSSWLNMSMAYYLRSLHCLVLSLVLINLRKSKIWNLNDIDIERNSDRFIKQLWFQK